MISEREFDWDDAKAATNLAKHAVPFTFAVRVFLDANVIDFDVSKPPDGEARRKAIGMIEGRIFAIVYTERGRLTRIISARRCNAKEGRLYGSLQARPQ